MDTITHSITQAGQSDRTDTLDTAISDLIAQEDVTARQHDILCSIPGLGPVTAAALLTFLPEMGSLDRKQAASSLDWRPSPISQASVSQASGRESPSSKADENNCATHSTCRRLSQCATTPT